MAKNLWLNGGVYSDEDGLFPEQDAPAAYTASFTFDVSDIRDTKLVTVTSASAVAATLPTGTVLDAAFGNLPVGASIDWNVINLGNTSGAVTLTAASGHTIVGNAVIAISTSTVLRTRKTAANTFVTYVVGG